MGTFSAGNRNIPAKQIQPQKLHDGNQPGNQAHFLKPGVKSGVIAMMNMKLANRQHPLPFRDRHQNSPATGVAELARDTLPRMGIEVTAVDMSDLDAVARAFRPNTRLIHTESPVNPILRLTDLAAVSELAHRAGALHSTDATFPSPLGMDTQVLGIDLVMHSITKYIGGHGDAVGGAVAGRTDLIRRLRLEASIHHGGILSPFNAWLLSKSSVTV